MTPQFTTPCYVRVEDKDKRNEVCEELERIGYKNGWHSTLQNQIITASTSGIYIDVLSVDNSDYIDCGTNTPMFLALAGMRSDRHKNQWYIFLPTGCLYQYTQTAGYPVPDAQGLRRATAQEIIERFDKPIE